MVVVVAVFDAIFVDWAVFVKWILILSFFWISYDFVIILVIANTPLTGSKLFDENPAVYKKKSL